MNGRIKIVVGLVGEKRAGKETFARHMLGAIDRNFWSPSHVHYTFSEPLYRILNDLDKVTSRQNLQKLAESLCENIGPDSIRQGMENLIEKESAELIIADGVRRPREEKYVRGLENNLMVYVTASQEVRFERALKAQNAKPGEKEMTWEEFLATEKAITEADIADIGSRADFKVVNEEDPENLDERAKIFFEMLLKPMILKIKEKAHN